MNQTKGILLTALLTGCSGYYRFTQKTIVLSTTTLDVKTEINLEDYRLRICERRTDKSTEGMSDEARRYILNRTYCPQGYMLVNRSEVLNKSGESCVLYNYILKNDEP